MNNWIVKRIKRQVDSNKITVAEGLSYALKFGLLGNISKEQETQLVTWLESKMSQEESGE